MNMWSKKLNGLIGSGWSVVSYNVNNYKCIHFCNVSLILVIINQLKFINRLENNKIPKYKQTINNLMIW